MTINEKKSEKFNGLAALIGHTPMLEISLLYKGEARIVYAKAEYYNYSGSIKDRVACHILRQAYETGAIAEGMPIAEATSGNTGIAFAAIGAYLGNPFTIFMPDWMSKERINLIDDCDATNMSRKLARVLGLGVGISSGVNNLGVLKAQDLLGNKDAVVATVFADDNKKYLSTDLMYEQTVSADHLACDVELLGMRAIR